MTLAAFSVACERNRDRADAQREASTSSTIGTSDLNRVSRTDKTFVRDIAIAETAEIELSKLVPERSSNTEIKKFAQEMIDDHGKSMRSLKALADQYKVQVPADLDSRRSRLRDKLAKLRAGDFDREYVDAIVDGHEEALDKLGARVDEENPVLPEKSDNAATTSLNQWAATAYPAVRSHLEAAKALKTAIDKGR